MIAIVNVTPDSHISNKDNDYEVRINQQIIVRFKHDRKTNGLAECLRMAADAVDKKKANHMDDILLLIDSLPARDNM